VRGWGTTDHTNGQIVHRLLFRALIEIRARGHEHKDELVFHLADLFHNVVLEMEAAAEGRSTYEEALRQLTEKAREKGCERWLELALAEVKAAKGSG
jgi:hypothetical protein